jgi:hypothetical protein
MPRGSCNKVVFWTACIHTSEEIPQVCQLLSISKIACGMLNGESLSFIFFRRVNNPTALLVVSTHFECGAVREYVKQRWGNVLDAKYVASSCSFKKFKICGYAGHHQCPNLF